MAYKINTHCRNGESIFDAADRILGDTPHMVSTYRNWEDYIRNPNAPLPGDIPVGYEFAGFVTVRQQEIFPVFTKG